MNISIHVPAWGTTTLIILYRTIHSNFNPRSRVGNDVCSSLRASKEMDFNPRSRVGNDLPANVIYIWLVGFQSTFPRGERLTAL